MAKQALEDQMNQFIAQVREKIDRVVEEFAEGKISRTQFQQLYDRYQNQILSVTQLSEAQGDMNIKEITGSGQTVAIRKKLTAVAKGLVIYENKIGQRLETLGHFDVPEDQIDPTLENFRRYTVKDTETRLRSQPLSDEDDGWLVWVPGDYTTLIALFNLEPSPHQLTTIKQLHRDFENANRAFLESGDAQADKMAFPFRVILRMTAGNKE
jgi:hypothetical protein